LWVPPSLPQGVDELRDLAGVSGGVVSVEDLEAVFARYQPAGWRRVVGDLLTLNLKALFGRK